MSVIGGANQVTPVYISIGIDKPSMKYFGEYYS